MGSSVIASANALFFAATLACPLTWAAPPDPKVIVLRGSDTLGAKLVPRWAEGFRKAGHDVRFDIAAEGTGTAFTNLGSRKCRIGMANRQMRDDEASALQGVVVQSLEVARDRFAIVVNVANPINSLTPEQVEAIFCGDVTHWSQVGGTSGSIAVCTPNVGSGSSHDFRTLAMSGREYAANADRMGGGDAPALQVANNADGITFCGLPHAKANGVKIVAINGVLPGDAYVGKAYPYERSLRLYVADDATAEEKQFIQFVQSAPGQQILTACGFLPPRKVQKSGTPAR